MGKNITITKTSIDGNIESFSIKIKCEKEIFKQVTQLLQQFSTSYKYVDNQTYATITTNQRKGITWNPTSVKVRGIDPFIVLNALNRCINNLNLVTNLPKNANEARSELEKDGYEFDEVDNTDTSGI